MNEAEQAVTKIRAQLVANQSSYEDMRSAWCGTGEWLTIQGLNSEKTRLESKLAEALSRLP